MIHLSIQVASYVLLQIKSTLHRNEIATPLPPSISRLYMTSKLFQAISQSTSPKTKQQSKQAFGIAHRAYQGYGLVL